MLGCLTSCSREGLLNGEPRDTSIGCGAGQTCAAPAFCEAPTGACPSAPSAADVCTARPTDCSGTSAKQPECGCDQQTYANHCLRRAAGVSLAHSGACEEQCPADLFGAIGKPCHPEGLSCGGEGCTNVCEFCNVVVCLQGKWTGLEAFPKPDCNACEQTGGYCDPGDYDKPACKEGFHEDEAIVTDNPGVCGLGICCAPNMH